MAIVQPTILGIGKVSPAVKKYKPIKITTRFKVFPTAVGTVPSVDKTIFWNSLYKLKLKPHMNMFRRKLLGLESL
jgi:hypothetical protein